MEKQYRFSNGFVGTMVEYASKYGVGKEINFKNTCKRVSRDRYNNMVWSEQNAYKAKRKLAVLDYRVYTDENTFVQVTKTDYDKINIPVQMPDIKHAVFIRPKRKDICFNYLCKKRGIENFVVFAMQQFEKDAREQAYDLLLGAGYIHTANVFGGITVESYINHTDVTVCIELADQTKFVFHYGSMVGNYGVDYCALKQVEMTGSDGKTSKILRYQCQYEPYNVLLSQMYVCWGTIEADLVYCF